MEIRGNTPLTMEQTCDECGESLIDEYGIVHMTIVSSVAGGFCSDKCANDYQKVRTTWN